MESTLPSDHVQDTKSGSLFTVTSNLSFVRQHKTTCTTEGKEKHEAVYVIRPSKSVKTILYVCVCAYPHKTTEYPDD